MGLVVASSVVRGGGMVHRSMVHRGMVHWGMMHRSMVHRGMVHRSVVRWPVVGNGRGGKGSKEDEVLK